MSKTIKINYKKYPECMFAMIAAYLPPDEAREVRQFAGKVVFRHTDENGSTYKNGLLHSYDDKPAVNKVSIHGKKMSEWYKDGLLHREGGLHAVDYGDYLQWWVNGKKHREGGLNAVESYFFGNLCHQEWWVNGNLHRDDDLPAYISKLAKITKYYKNGVIHRDGNKPAWIDHRFDKEYFYQNGEEVTKEGIPLTKKVKATTKATTTKKVTTTKATTTKATTKKVTATTTKATTTKATATNKVKETVEAPLVASKTGMVTRSQTRAKKLM